jgi:hypothetical protein
MELSFALVLLVGAALVLLIATILRARSLRLALHEVISGEIDDEGGAGIADRVGDILSPFLFRLHAQPMLTADTLYILKYLRSMQRWGFVQNVAVGAVFYALGLLTPPTILDALMAPARASDAALSGVAVAKDGGDVIVQGVAIPAQFQIPIPGTRSKLTSATAIVR